MKEKILTLIVSLIVLFGSAFAIMSFNEDVAVESLFQKLYILINGKEHEGFGIIECTYGIGVALGITIFFNHFGRKNSDEPTPIELKMQQYDDDIEEYVNKNKQQ